MRHRCIARLIYPVLALAWLALPGPIARAQAGSSGLAFLKLGVSGRGISMGDAMGAAVTGAAATYYNPAGILIPAEPGSTAQLLLMHKEWIQDTQTEFLGASVLLGQDNALGFSVNSTTTSDIEIRTRPGPPDGTFSARNYSVGLSFAHLATEDLRLGITGKFLYQKILIDQTSGFGIDIGGHYRTPVEHLSVGAVIANIGKMGALVTQQIKLPTSLRLGAAYNLGVVDTATVLTVAGDFVHILPDNRAYLDLGAECFFNRIIAARAGYQFGSEGRGFSAGVGIQYGIVSFDYAYAPLSFDLGNTHTFSLALNL